MKRILSFIFISAFTLGSIFAVEYGGLINSDSSFKKSSSDDFIFTEKLDTSAYLKIPFSKEGHTTLSTEFVYRFQYDDAKADHFINLSLLKLNHSSEVSDGLVNIAAGRFSMAENTGKIFNQTSDGLFGSYQTGSFMGSMYFGYTGLINRYFTTMNEMGITEYSGFTSDFYTSSLPYLVIGAELAFPNLFLEQSLGIASWNFIGIQKLKSNKIYGTLSLNGPLVENLYHNTHGIFAGILGDGTEQVAGLASTLLSYYFNYRGLAANAGITYASKDFQTVTSTSGLVTGDPWTNLFLTSLSASMLPITSLYVGAETNFVMVAENMEYAGTGLAGVISYQLFSDVALSLNASHFFAKHEAAKYTQISIKAAISF